MNRREAMVAMGAGALVTGVEAKVELVERIKAEDNRLTWQDSAYLNFVLTFKRIGMYQGLEDGYAVLHYPKAMINHIELDEIAEELTKIYPRTTAIVITGYATILDQERLKDLLEDKDSIFHVLIERTGKITIGSRVKLMSNGTGFKWIGIVADFSYHEIAKHFNFWYSC
jgi:hypothetical protein